jgi:ADP-heptose:LPS heptosyltransferase
MKLFKGRVAKDTKRGTKLVWFFIGNNVVRMILVFCRPFRSVPESKEVILLRMDGIGDSVIFSGALKHIREAYSDTKLTIVVRPYVKSLYDSCPYIDRLIEWNNKSFVWNPIYRLRFLWSISSTKVEVLLCPIWTKSAEVEEFLRTIECVEVVAFETYSDSKTIGRRAMFVSVPKTIYREIDRYVFFLKKIISTFQLSSILKTEIWLNPKNSANIEKKYPNIKNRKYVAVVPGAGWVMRQWPAEKWILLLLTIQIQYKDYDFVLLGGIDDRSLCEQIKEKVNNQNIRNLCSYFNLNELAQVIKNSCLCIGEETGAIHIAAACEIPTICIMGGGHFGRFYPYGDLTKNIVVNRMMDCYGCDWKCIYPTTRCIQEIEIGNVVNAIVQNL